MFEGELSYAFCRSRLGKAGGHLIHMVENGNAAHRRLLIQISNMNPDLRRWINELAETPGSIRPPVELKENSDTSFFDSDRESEETPDYIKDPTTGRTIWEDDSIAIIYRFAS